jgi:hypothetical protein
VSHTSKKVDFLAEITYGPAVACSNGNIVITEVLNVFVGAHTVMHGARVRPHLEGRVVDDVVFLVDMLVIRYGFRTFIWV